MGSWPLVAVLLGARRCSSANGAKRAGWPPMIASAIGSPSAPARATDCGVPPTAIQTGSGSWTGPRVDAEAGDRRAGGVPVPGHDLAALADRQQQREVLGEQLVVVVERSSRTAGSDSMKEPRPAMISARPPESRSSVAKSWKTRTGSSELSTDDGAR